MSIDNMLVLMLIDVFNQKRNLLMAHLCYI